MKKISVLLFLFILLSTAVLAIDTDLQSNYQPGQTLIAKFSGIFLSNIDSSSVYFYSNRDFIPMTYNIGKINSDFYLYSVLPINERNYTLIIKDVKSLELGKEVTQDLYYNFSVAGNVSDFSVNPGFIITNDNFSVKLTSNINPIEITSTFLNNSQSVEVNPISQETLKFLISQIKKSGLNYLYLKSGNQKYSIPVYVFRSSVNASAPQIKLEFSKSKLNFTVLKNQDFQFKVILYNRGQEDLTNITIFSDLSEIKINPNLTDLVAGDSLELNLTILSKDEDYKLGYLAVEVENFSLSIPVYLLTSANQTYVSNIIKNDSGNLIGKTCSELQGKVCDEGTLCEAGGTQLTLDGKICCLKTCNKISSGLSSGKWIALIIIVVVIAGIGYMLFRRSRLKRINPKEIIKKTAKDFEERFKPKETKGSITKI